MKFYVSEFSVEGSTSRQCCVDLPIQEGDIVENPEVDAGELLENIGSAKCKDYFALVDQDALDKVTEELEQVKSELKEALARE